MQRSRVFFFVCIVLMSATSGALGVTTSANRAPTARVRIIPVDIYGQELSETKVIVEGFAPVLGGQRFVDHFHGASASEIPYGTYLLHVGMPGFWSSERRVRVFQPDVVVVVSLAVGVEGSPQTSTVSGRIKDGSRAAVPPRIRLCSVYADIVVDVDPSSSGDFSALEVPNSNYILIVTRAGTVLSARPIHVPLDSPIDIDLAAKPIQ